MFHGAYRLALVTVLMVSIGVGTVGVASANDLGKVLLGVAAGVLVYKALDNDNGCNGPAYYAPQPCSPPYVRAEQPWDKHRRYNPPPNYGYYAPSPRQAYDQGYGDGWKDGKSYGYQKGAARGYGRGYRDGYGVGYDRGSDRGRGWARY